MAEVHRKQEYYSRRNVPVEVLDSKALEQAEPHLRKGMAGGLLVPEDVVLYPPCAARFLLERAQRAGAEVKVGSAVTQIGQGRVSLDNGTEFSSAIIINAAGVGSTALTPGLGIKKRKGHLLITDRYPNVVRHQLVELGYLKSAHSTAPGDPRGNSGGILAPIRCRVQRSGQRYPRPHAAAGRRIHSLSIRNVGDPGLDRIPGGHSRQASADWTVAGRQDFVPCYRTRRVGNHHFDC